MVIQFTGTMKIKVIINRVMKVIPGEGNLFDNTAILENPDV